MAQTRHGKSRLLDDADQNIGNASLINADNIIIVNPITNPTRLLDLTSESDKAQIATVGFDASSNPPALNSNQAQFAGPLTGILEYGNGSVFTRVEFDVPVGKILSTDSISNAQDGGVIVSVPAGTLRAYARNDANLVTPSFINNSPPGGPNVFGFPAGAGPGNKNQPRGQGSWQNPLFQTIPANMKAFATYFTRSNGVRTRNTKTIWVYNNVANPVQVADGLGTPAMYFIPPLAKTVQVMRNNLAAAVTLEIYDSQTNTNGFVDQFTIAAAANSPIIDLPGQTLLIGIKTTAALVGALCLVFEIGI